MIVVHIGMPKAGSTTIQNFLYDNEVSLRQLSVDYSQISRESHKRRKAHHNLANEMKARPTQFDPDAGNTSDLSIQLQKTTHQTTIISSEMFAYCPIDGVCQLKERLKVANQPIRIVLIIRDLLDLIPSAYAQSVRFGFRTDDFDTFFDTILTNERSNHFEIASQWAEVFGWEAVRVRVLSTADLLNGDLIDDFMATAGLDPDAPALRALPRPPRANESAGWKTLEAVRALFGGRSALDERHTLSKIVQRGRNNKAPKKVGFAAEAIGATNGWNAERGLYLTTAQAEASLDTYRSWVNRLNDHLVVKLEGAA